MFAYIPHVYKNKQMGWQWLSGEVFTSQLEGWVFDPQPLRKLP